MLEGRQNGLTSEQQVVFHAAEGVLRPCALSREQARLRLDSLTKPQGSLGYLEEALVIAAGAQRLALPRFDKAHVVIFAGDHGVVDEGVSAYPAEVTAQMVRNFLGGGAAVSALADQAGAQVHVVDIGVRTAVSHPLLIERNVRRGTRNFANEPAMTVDEVWKALAIGVELGLALAEGGGRVMVLGEMGIGNTTASTALLAAITGLPVASLTGPGTGVDATGLARKVSVIETAIALHRPKRGDPIDLLCKLGGLEIAGLAGLAIGAAARQALLVMDGLISTVAVLLAVLLEPRVKQYVLAGHVSAEPGHAIALEQMGQRPLVQLGMRLGEASGALLGLTLLQSGARAMEHMATFKEAAVATGSDTTDREGSLSRAADAPDLLAVTATSPLSGVRADQSGGAKDKPDHANEFSSSEREAVYKAIYLRRDIRTFRSDPLPEEAVHRILQAGHHAPSVGYMQPWNFVLIRSAATKQALRDVVDRERRAAALHFRDERSDQYLRLKVEGLREAPLTVCVTSDPTRGGDHVLGRNSIPETDLFSVSCAIENMWLAARAENIALGWVSIFKKPDVRSILGIPPHVDPVGLLSLGYTEQWPDRPLLESAGWRQRIPFTRVLFEERWGVTR
ncbi:MAG: nicotinate-nucleotide--dimethylbenzimidazole phosphoribosyltransferase [Firmicutes bacterium]|nr:nicotinate-nucleotide--dimethylbenzimidazole phosphoribosyltransferase [Bacillota bacterium]